MISPDDPTASSEILRLLKELVALQREANANQSAALTEMKASAARQQAMFAAYRKIGRFVVAPLVVAIVAVLASVLFLTLFPVFEALTRR